MEPDVLQFTIYPNKSKYVSSSIIKGRRITLFNIPVTLTQEGDKVSFTPAIPMLSGLMNLLNLYPEYKEVRWTSDGWIGK